MKPDPKNQFELTSGGMRTWFGIGLLLTSALAFTLNILIINMAFEDGLDVNTANAGRFIVTIALLFFFLKIRGRQLKLPPQERYKALALGITVFMIGVGYISATWYIPVSLAVLIFYTFPFFVAIISRFTENEPIPIIRLVVIIIAFIGLALALEVQSVASLNWRGITYAFLAAIGCALLVTISSHTMRTADPQAVNFHCLAAGTVLFVVFLLITGGPARFVTQAGWLKLCVSSLTLGVGYVTFFAGLEIIGPFKTAMLMNLEPVTTVILAAILLDERLSSMQLLGAGLVIVGIILITGGFRKANNGN
jgi:drug/metabolite transporter (DMT)-like permease